METDMHIRLNGEERELSSKQSVGQLVAELSGTDEPQGVAVAINGQIVRRTDWHSRELQAQDDVEVLQAVSGG